MTNDEAIAPASAPSVALDALIGDLRDALWHRKPHASARVIVGAGFSRNATPKQAEARPFPLWPDLAKALSTSLPAGADLEDALRVAQAYAAQFGEAGLHTFLESQIPDAEYDPGELHRLLLRLPWVDVFTTNYDTLLERASAGVRDTPYHTIVQQEELAGKYARRIVKLHGTIGTPAKLIATLDDYLGYGTDFPGFTTLMRQALTESTFVLIGFRGDDPNFDQFWHWVRACLGSNAPKIYWCGLGLSEKRRLFFRSMSIIPIDLTGVAGEGTGSPHARALTWFLEQLDVPPPLELNWAPRETNTMNRGFTPFSAFPPGSDQTIETQPLLDAVAIWKQQRREYPGWHVLPLEVMERLYGVSEYWRHRVFHSAAGLPPITRLTVLFEYYWRLDRALSPIFTIEADRFAGWLEEVDPFGGAIALPSAVAPAPAEVKDAAEAWIFLAFCILRTAREDLDHGRFACWHDRIKRVTAGDVAWSGEVCHEGLLYSLTRLDLAAFRTGLADWKKTAVTPLEFARLAAYHSERGDKEQALECSGKAISLLDPATPAGRWLEAWCHLVRKSQYFPESHPNQVAANEAIARAKRQGYDIWELVEHFRAAIAKLESNPRPRVSHTPRFDDGDIRQSISLSGGTNLMPAFQLLRFLERAPVGIYAGAFSNFAEAATGAGVLIGRAAPPWVLMSLLRAQAKPEAVDGYIDRLAIATCPSAEAEATCATLVRLIRTEFEQAAGDEDNMGTRMIIASLDILSRYVLRLPPPALLDLIQLWRSWYGHPLTRERHGIASPLGELLERAISGLPDDAITQVVTDLLPLPVFGEKGFRPDMHEQMWPDPFDAIMSRVSSKPSDWQISPEVWNRLLLFFGNGPVLGRSDAFTRLYYLHLNQWLSPEQDDAFEDALWRYVDPVSNLPSIPHYRSRLVLRMRGAGKRNAAALLKQSLLSRLPNPWVTDSGTIDADQLWANQGWIDGLVPIFRHELLAGKKEILLPLEPAEAVHLAQGLLDWWGRVKAHVPGPHEKVIGLGAGSIESIVRSFLSVFGESLLFRLPPSHLLIGRAMEEFKHLDKLGYSLMPLLPGELFVDPSQTALAAMRLVRALLSEDPAHFRAGVLALRAWHRGGLRGLLPPLPGMVLDVAATRLALLHEPGLALLCHDLAAIVEALDKDCPERLWQELLLALIEAEPATNPLNLKRRLDAGEIDRKCVVERLHLRSWLAFLARKLEVVAIAKNNEIPVILRIWEEIRRQAVLPELRRA